MPLTALPSELDLSILEYVHAAGDLQALLAISCISRYYHRIAEPILYETIAITSHAEFRIKGLIMTLLDRRNLAHHIKRFTIRNESSRSSNVKPEDPQRLETLSRYVLKIQSVIHSYHPTNSSLPPSLTWPWSTLFKSHSSIDPSRVSVDAALALVLILAKNVEKVEIAFPKVSNLRITRNVIAFPWQEKLLWDAPQPFTKLTDLRVESCTGKHDHLPHEFWRTSANSLCVRNFSLEDTLFWPAAHIHLRRLELHNARIDPDKLVFFVSARCCLNLRQLSLKEISHSRQDWDMYDVQSLVDLLARYVPHLECFEYDGTSALGLLGALTSFRHFHRMHTLRLNMKYLYYQDFIGDENLSWDTESLLPPSLQHLDLGRLTYSDLLLMRLSHKLYYSDPDSDLFKKEAQLWTFLADPAPNLKLKSFSLEVIRDATKPVAQDTRIRLSEVDVDLNRFANEATNRGLKYCVYECDLRCGHG